MGGACLYRVPTMGLNPLALNTIHFLPWTDTPPTHTPDCVGSHYVLRGRIMLGTHELKGPGFPLSPMHNIKFHGTDIGTWALPTSPSRLLLCPSSHCLVPAFCLPAFSLCNRSPTVSTAPAPSLVLPPPCSGLTFLDERLPPVTCHRGLSNLPAGSNYPPVLTALAICHVLSPLSSP